MQVEAGYLLGCHFYPCGVLAPLQFRLDVSTRLGGRIRHQLDNHGVADERSATPVLRDVSKHPMLDLMPLTWAWGKMTHGNMQVLAVRPRLEFTFHPGAIPVLRLQQL